MRVPGSLDPLLAELMAIRTALKFAMEAGLRGHEVRATL